MPDEVCPLGCNTDKTNYLRIYVVLLLVMEGVGGDDFIFSQQKIEQKMLRHKSWAVLG